MSEAQDKRKKEKKTRLSPIKSSRRVTTRLYGQRIPHILADIRKRKLFPTLILTFKLGKIKEFYRNHEMVNVTVNDKVYCCFKSRPPLPALQEWFWISKIKFAHALLVRHHFILRLTGPKNGKILRVTWSGNLLRRLKVGLNLYEK